MTKTKRQKQYIKERKICNPSSRCLKCGGKLGSHHFFCNDCWTPGLMYSKEMKDKIRELKRAT